MHRASEEGADCESEVREGLAVVLQDGETWVGVRSEGGVGSGWVEALDYGGPYISSGVVSVWSPRR